ncbi:DUF3592 domain-containing protein [Pseudonocardia sp. N23]|uniref:DUF3592 domain-containing protein n=1 Tax=Pseudonocardia sp. N23 TaxID=1987376 RepID=UPI000BFE23D5|nr:DUF3592 domain-containing protein [Pseudonocardia sp. N23]GAY08907.1 possible membrane protein [Pseudonocardia sp. N23]
MSGSGSELIEAVGSTLRAAGAWLRRHKPECVTGFAVLVTVLVALAFVGALLDDRAIASNRAFTAATVLDGSNFSRTLVRFTLPDGQAVVPERGVMYPRGLEPGSTIIVEYSTEKPSLVRVAGRSALDRLPVLLGTAAGVWVVFGAWAWWLRRRRAERDVAAADAGRPVDAARV